MADISTTIYDKLKKDIISLKIKPGEKLSEQEVCERFSVTRPSVRAAFQRLQDTGLLEVVPYKGARTTLINLSSVHQLIHLRIAVESWLIKDFIKSKPSPFLLEELEHNIRMQKLHTETESVDEKEFYRLDSAFHQFWFDRMKCSDLWTMIQTDMNYERFRMLDFVGTLGYKDIVADHVKLFEAIRDSNTDMVVPILTSHLNAGLKRMGYPIRDDYKAYFIQDENVDKYWQDYNAELIKLCK
ncbi:MAG: GntR family transcriptional regulator [Sphaerochaetaceae bacterium]|nr:GntR family transcriptional regulator [Sphaerochaetaceae bacterium]